MAAFGLAREHAPPRVAADWSTSQPAARAPYAPQAPAISAATALAAAATAPSSSTAPSSFAAAAPPAWAPAPTTTALAAHVPGPAPTVTTTSLPPASARTSPSFVPVVSPPSGGGGALDRVSAPKGAAYDPYFESLAKAVAAKESAAENLLRLFREENEGLREEARFLEEQLDAARKEIALLNVKLENSAVAREEGAVLYAKLSDIITKSQFTEMQKDAEINRLSRQLEERDKELGRLKDENKLHELEWEVEREALHSALATASGLSPRASAGEEKASQGVLSASVAADFESEEFTSAVAEFRPVLAGLFSQYADLAPGHEERQLRGRAGPTPPSPLDADPLNPSAKMSRSLFLQLCTDAGLLASEGAPAAADSALSVVSARSGLAFGQFIATLLVLAHSLFQHRPRDASPSQGPVHGALFRHVVTTFLLPLASGLGIVGSGPGPYSSSPFPSSSYLPSPVLAPDFAATSRSGTGAGFSGGGGVGRGRSRSRSPTSSVNGSVSVRGPPSVVKSHMRHSVKSDRSGWMGKGGGDTGPLEMVRLSPEHRFAGSSMMPGGAEASPAALDATFSMDNPEVRDVFDKDRTALRTIFEHYHRNRPTSYRNRNPGPVNRWTFRDLTRFAHDFRVTPGVAAMPQLLEQFQQAVRADPGSSTPSSASGRGVDKDLEPSIGYTGFLVFLGHLAVHGFTQKPPFRAPPYAVMSLFQWLDRSDGRNRMQARDGTAPHFVSRSAFRP